MIGDGATDAEACPPADAFIGELGGQTGWLGGRLLVLKIHFSPLLYIFLSFIGFGGNVVRESVKAKAKWFVTSFQEIIDELNMS